MPSDSQPFWKEKLIVEENGTSTINEEHDDLHVNAGKEWSSTLWQGMRELVLKLTSRLADTRGVENEEFPRSPGVKLTSWHCPHETSGCCVCSVIQE